MAQVLIFSDTNGLLGFSRYAGPYRVATELRDSGFDVQVIEFFAEMSMQQIEKVLDKYVTSETLFVGFSATLWGKGLSYEENEKLWKTPPLGGLKHQLTIWTDLFPHSDSQMKDVFGSIRDKNPKAKIVVGGYKALNRSFEGIDYWVVGQGEGPSVAIARHLRDGEPLRVLETELGNVITDRMYQFDGFSKCKIYWTEKDHIFPGEDLQIETARGCIFKCAFCAFNLNGKKFGDFTKDPEVLRDELIHNYEKFGTTGYMVADDTFNDSMRKVSALYDVFTSLPFKVRLSVHLRLDILMTHPEMALMLKELGVRSVNFGIETFCQRAGRAIGKGADPDRQKNYLYELRDIWKDEVFVSGNFIVGLPHEPVDSIRKTFEWLYDKDCPLSGISVNALITSNGSPSVNPKGYTDQQMRDFGFVKGHGGWQHNNISKIEENSQKYGIEMIDGNPFNWQGQFVDKTRADELVDEFYASPRARQKFTLAMFHNYNRMMNIGYTLEEVRNLYQDDPKVIDESLRRRERLKNEYLEKVL